MTVAEICGKGGFSGARFYKSPATFGGIQASEAMRLRELEEENSRLKKRVAEAHSYLCAEERPRDSRGLTPDRRFRLPGAREVNEINYLALVR